MGDNEKTPGQLATEKARAASIRTKKMRAAERHAAQWIEGLELIGYTVYPPHTGRGFAPPENDETPGA